jgi:hypothetical protein
MQLTYRHPGTASGNGAGPRINNPKRRGAGDEWRGFPELDPVLWAG